MATKVGVLGIGMMGKGMILNLLKAGFEVYAYDPFPAAQEKGKELGAAVMPGVKEVAEKVEVLFASLPTTQAVQEAANEAIAVMQKGGIICNMSTSAPAVEKILYEEAKKKGIGYLDSPVSGGPKGAENATMSIMVGGDQDVYDKARPFYEKIGGNIWRIGDIGAGQVMKLCNNSVLASNSIVLAENFMTAVAAGLDAQVVYDVFKVSTAHSRAFDLFAGNMINDTYDNMIFAAAHMHKDMDLFVDLANELEVAVPYGSNAHQYFNAAIKKGFGGKDMSVVAKVVEDLAGAKIKK